MKTCRICKVEKPLEQFSPHKKYKLGVINECKQCVAAAHRANTKKKSKRERESESEKQERKKEIDSIIKKRISENRKITTTDKIIKAILRKGVETVSFETGLSEYQLTSWANRVYKIDTQALLRLQDYFNNT